MRSKKRFAIGCLAVIVAVVGVIGVRIYSIWRRTENELAQIRAAGEPLTEDDLVDFFSFDASPPEAADAWFEATGAMKPLMWSEINLPLVGQYNVTFNDAFFDESLEVDAVLKEFLDEKVTEFLAKHSEAVKLFHIAAQQDGTVRLPVDRESWNKVWDFAWKLRTAARILALDAMVRAQEGDHQGAASSIHAIYRAGRCLEDPPRLAMLAVRSTINAAAASTLERLLPITEFTDEQLAMLQDDLAVVDYRRGVYAGLLASRVSGINTLQESRSIDWSGGDVRFRGDVSDYLRRMRNYIDASRLAWPEALDRAKALSSETPHNETEGLLDIATETTSLLEYWPSVFAVYAQRTAWNRAAYAAMAVERFQRRRGRLPEMLRELVPQYLSKLPADPFDGDALRYRLREDGYVVYSVGPNGVDNGGWIDRSGLFPFDGAPLWSPGFRIYGYLMKPDVGFRGRARAAGGAP